MVLLINGEPHAEAKLCVVFKQRVRPGGPTPLAVLRIRCRWKISAVDRRAARRVANQQTIAEQLGQQLEVRSLTATRASTREFKQRLEQLRIFDLCVRNPL